MVLVPPGPDKNKFGTIDCSALVASQVFMLRERAQLRSHLEKVRDAAKVRRYTEKWFRFSSDPPETIR